MLVLKNYMKKEKLVESVSPNSVLGLKGCLKQYKGCAFGYKVKCIYHELKWAWQRAWKGYDNRDVWNLNDRLLDRLIVLLYDYKNNKHCLWWCPEGYDWSNVCELDKHSDKYVFNEEQIDVIIDTLIFHLKMCNADYVEKMLFEKNVYDDDYKIGCRTEKDNRKIWNVRKQNQDAAIKLLGLLMDELWD